jgi:hypothetical protein
VERTGGDIDIRWSVVSLVGGLSNGSMPNHATPPHGGRGGDAEPLSTNPGGAKEALDRIAIPQDTLVHKQCRLRVAVVEGGSAAARPDPVMAISAIRLVRVPSASTMIPA